MISQLAACARNRQASRRTVLAAWTAAVFAGIGVAVAAPPARPPLSPARSKTIVDRAVVPAGGLACRQCRGGDCPLHRGHLAECRDGRCGPHCPVRPSEYGFYRTEWRRWPGQGVVPVGAEQAATPAQPPASQVPTVDEESPRMPAEELPAVEAGGEDRGAGRPAPLPPGDEEPAGS